MDVNEYNPPAGAGVPTNKKARREAPGVAIEC
jgi:hypothetical protein